MLQEELLCAIHEANSGGDVQSGPSAWFSAEPPDDDVLKYFPSVLHLGLAPAAEAEDPALLRRLFSAAAAALKVGIPSG